MGSGLTKGIVRYKVVQFSSIMRPLLDTTFSKGGRIIQQVRLIGNYAYEHRCSKKKLESCFYHTKYNSYQSAEMRIEFTLSIKA